MLFSLREAVKGMIGK